MAVQKSRKSKAKAKTRRTKKLSFSQIITDPVTGEKVLRHHVTNTGFYKGSQVTPNKVASKETDE
jgi:large subunit ribosomal protein L32